MAKKESGLSDNEFEQELEILKRKDLSFASKLHSLQEKNFPKRLKNMSEWSEAEKVKRLILGMNTDKQDHSGTIQHTVEVVDYSSTVRAKNGGGS
jgi:RNase H-fold protein (predicted Holliday junction resolvase)